MSREQEQDNGSWQPLLIVGLLLMCLSIQKNIIEPMGAEALARLKLMLVLGSVFAGVMSFAIYWAYFSKQAKADKEKRKQRAEVPSALLVPSRSNVYIGDDLDLETPIYLPDSIRSRHVHILGTTGSGKTESVVLNMLGQDVDRGCPALVLDAKGDQSFLEFLKVRAPDRLKVFDLSSAESPCTYDPLSAGTATEAAQRLFSSLIWSEPYYRAKARAILFRCFEALERHNAKRTFGELASILSSVNALNGVITPKDGSLPKISERDFEGIAGLRDQITVLGSGHFRAILSQQDGKPNIQIGDDLAADRILYFRLQALLDPDSVSFVGRLVITDLAFCAGQRHREIKK